jgi:hypothetical protein
VLHYSSVWAHEWRRDRARHARKARSGLEGRDDMVPNGPNLAGILRYSTVVGDRGSWTLQLEYREPFGDRYEHPKFISILFPETPHGSSDVLLQLASLTVWFYGDICEWPFSLRVVPCLGSVRVFVDHGNCADGPSPSR